MIFLPYVCALVWGIVWASALQWTRFGRWLAFRRTWLTVVVGVGVDLLIALLVVDPSALLVVASIIALSAIGIIVRSLANELRATMEIVDGE